MRHKVVGKTLGRHAGARNALRRIMVKQLFEHERIRTTRAKAQAIRGQAEKLITLAKRALATEDTGRIVHARRLAAARAPSRRAVHPPPWRRGCSRRAPTAATVRGHAGRRR